MSNTQFLIIFSLLFGIGMGLPAGYVCFGAALILLILDYKRYTG